MEAGDNDENPGHKGRDRDGVAKGMVVGATSSSNAERKIAITGSECTVNESGLLQVRESERRLTVNRSEISTMSPLAVTEAIKVAIE